MKLQNIKWQIHAETSVHQIMLWIILAKLFGGIFIVLAVFFILGNIATLIKSVKQLPKTYFNAINKNKNTRPEIVICSAVKATNGQIFRGHRHSDCFRAIVDRMLTPDGNPEAQGFITSSNRFVGREEAYRIQRAANIPSADKEEGYTKGPCLYSEDLY